MPKKGSVIYELAKNKALYLMTLPGIIFFFVFDYITYIGIVMAFQDFDYSKGIFGSKFVGLRNIRFVIESGDLPRIVFNTLFLNLLFIFTGLIFSIGIAILLNEITRPIYKKVTQSVSILPHFLSWTVVAMFLLTICSPESGLINKILKNIGLEPINFYGDPRPWPLLLTILRIWKGAGWGSIIYLATITGIDPELFEAARIDGASRLQCIKYITLPELKQPAILLTLMGLGNIFKGDFGMIYALVGDNSLLFPTTDVIDTYVFRALRQLNDVGMSAAVGLMQSIVGFILVVIVNTLVKRIDEEAAIF